MSRAEFLWSICIPFVLLDAATATGQPPAPRTRAESTDFEETSRYDDVVRFIEALQRFGPRLRVETFGHSREGRALPLLILADPPISQPREARDSGKPVVLVMANIHAGEVEGKESALRLAREVLTGPRGALLDKMILLIAPIYNADGNERVSTSNRPEQFGPIGGVGRRENADGLDLNRDFMKLQAPESRALVGLFNRWDPHLTVDLHTTNGSYHGYHLTYSIPLNPSVDPRIVTYQRERMMPAIARTLLDRHRYRSYYYGNFEGPAPRPGAPETRTWRAFTHLPRIGQNYVGLRNRLAILSEAYSYLDFRDRVAVTSAFVDAILDHVASHGEEIVRLTRTIDVEAARGPSAKGLPPLAVESAMRPLALPVEILVGEVTKRKNPRSGLEMTVMTPDVAKPVSMLDYGRFEATRTVPRPAAYLLQPVPANRALLATLADHGVNLEETTAPLTADVEATVVAEVRASRRSTQGRQEIRIKGRPKTENPTFPAGTVFVRTAQPLGMLASYLLEPESDDGLVAWDLLGNRPAVGDVVPIYKLMRDVNAPTRLLDHDPEMRP